MNAATQSLAEISRSENLVEAAKAARRGESIRSGIRIRTFSVRTLILALATAFVAALFSSATATSASALCVSSPMTGNWRNIDSNTRSLTRVVVNFHCGDQVLCDDRGNCTGGQSYFTLRPFGACTPTACDWGTKRAQRMQDGWQRATYVHSWATKHVWVKTYVYHSKTYLRVWTWTDFTAADGRTDYKTDEWMLK